MGFIFTRKAVVCLLSACAMLLIACGGEGGELTVEQSVALTVAAANNEQAVAQTVAALNAGPTLSVDQIVALTVAASTAAIPDVVDPNLNITDLY